MIILCNIGATHDQIHCAYTVLLLNTADLTLYENNYIEVCFGNCYE